MRLLRAPLAPCPALAGRRVTNWRRISVPSRPSVRRARCFAANDGLQVATRLAAARTMAAALLSLFGGEHARERGALAAPRPGQGRPRGVPHSYSRLAYKRARARQCLIFVRFSTDCFYSKAGFLRHRYMSLLLTRYSTVE